LASLSDTRLHHTRMPNLEIKKQQFLKKHYD